MYESTQTHELFLLLVVADAKPSDRFPLLHMMCLIFLFAAFQIRSFDVVKFKFSVFAKSAVVCMGRKRA